MHGSKKIKKRNDPARRTIVQKTGTKRLVQKCLGSANAYTVSLWPRLVRYTEEGRFRIDNNLI
ncbi:MAG TPA: hypothetical protein ENK25_10050 [Bacteroidetes bacterium]|nr:hypothetical protein [Bacteroidota bacterium]